MGTALVGMVNDAATFGVLTNDPHAEGREDGEENEDEDGSHRGDSKREMGLVFESYCLHYFKVLLANQQVLIPRQ